MKTFFTVAILSLAIGFGIGFGLNLNQPEPAVVVKAPVAVAPAVPTPAVLMTSAAVDSVLFESLWTAGGESYRDAVSSLADAYATKMDDICKVPGFSVQLAIATYDGFVPSGAEPMFAAVVKKQVRALACEKMNGARATALLQS